MTLVGLIPSEAGMIVPEWHWCNCSQVKLAWLFPSDTGTIVSKRHWHDCSQVTLQRLFLSDNGTIVPKWQWHDCSQVVLARLYPSDTGTIVSKWYWHDCSQVTLTQLFPSETGTIVPKWHRHDCSQVTLARLFQSGLWLSNLYYSTYPKSNFSKDDIIKNDKNYCQKFDLNLTDKNRSLSIIYWLPKLHKTSIGAKFIIASKNCSTKPLSGVISKIFKMLFKHVENFHNNNFNKSTFY